MLHNDVCPEYASMFANGVCRPEYANMFVNDVWPKYVIMLDNDV